MSEDGPGEEKAEKKLTFQEKTRKEMSAVIAL